ncbi:hypothetical protein NX059_002055 [Plenodomus lindquistii]|nr:hypothetical protein NX059_002055 [Plenodomus lindquistii]
MAYLEHALKAISLLTHTIWWPISKLIASLVFVLAPICRVGYFAILPFIYLGQVIVSILTFPFSVTWLDRIETLYVFLGTAALIGCITGGVLYAIVRVLSSTLNIDQPVVPKPRQKPRSVAEYRAAKAVKKEKAFGLGPSIPPVIVKKVPEFRRRKGLLSSVVIEEEDSDF